MANTLKNIMTLFFLVCFLTFQVLGQNISTKSYINITTTTNLDLTSVITNNAPNGNVHNSVFCNSISCTTNIYGGSIDIVPSQNISFNQYKTEYIAQRTSTGMTLNSLVHSLGKIAEDFEMGKNKVYGNSDAFDFWALLDYMFVSHKEHKVTTNNILYLAEEIDKLKAENYLLKKQLNISIEPVELECKTAVNKAYRTGMQVKTLNGWIAKPKVFGDTCIKLQTVEW